MFTGEDKKVRWGRVVAFIILGAIGAYLLLFSLIRVPPHTVIAVKVPGGIRPYVNESDKMVLRWKWPYIYKVTGWKEEAVKLPAVKKVTSAFAFYTVDEVSGKAEDKTKARAYFVDVKFKVIDWDKYLVEIDLDEINKARRQAGPWYPLMKDRAEVVIEPIKNMIRSGGSTDRFGRPLKTEEGYPAMDVSTRANYGFSQLNSRRNFIITLLEHHDLKEAEEIIEYLKEKLPWYWFAGPSTFEHLAQNWKDTIEATLSAYMENISPEAANQRVIFGEENIPLFQQALQAWSYEKFLMERERKLEDIGLQRKDFQEKIDKPLYSEGELVVKSFKDWLSLNGGDIKFIQNLEQLSQNYQTFGGEIESNIVLAFMRAEVEVIKKQLIEAEKEYIEFPLEKEDELKAKEFVQGLLRALKDEANREIWQLTGQGVGQAFDYYLANYLAKNELENLPDLSEKTKRYFGLQVTKTYAEALEGKVAEAEKFLNKVQIAKEFHLDIKAKLQGQKVDMTQLMENYFKGKQELFQTAAYLVNLSWQEEKLEFQERQWEEQIQETITFFKHYSVSDSELALMVRTVTTEENEALWMAAIEQALHGEDVTQLRPFWIHKIQKGETLAELVKRYEVNWDLAFHQMARMVIYQSLSIEKRTEFDHLLAEGMGNGDYEEAYEFAKDIPLEEGKSLTIWKVLQFSDKWFKMQEEYRKKRERIVKLYVYPIVEKFTPRVVEEYLFSPNSPWIDYIENAYGVEVLEVKLRVEDDEMFDKAGSVKPEYYDIYLSKAEEWKLGEEEKKEE